MVKKILLGAMSICMLFAFACNNAESGTTESFESFSTESLESSEIESSVSQEESFEEESSGEEEVHTHALTFTEEKKADCQTDGNLAYYTCEGCGKYFADEDGETEWTMTDITVAASHALTYHEEVRPSGKKNGTAAYYECDGCEKIFTDSTGIKETTAEELVIVAAMNIPDFVVEVEEGRDPVVLQLSDPQLCNWGSLESYCYQYIRETVEATKPDLIIITGDVVYGRFDPNGTLLQGIIAFMESLQIPWAPVFGNHDNESLKGVDWQCAQFEAAEYCLFKQGDLTGNGNYSVGLAQGEELLRVFYMMDSNGCGKPMCDADGVQTAPAAGTNIVRTYAGFGEDQIKWYTEEINAIHAVDADVKISFAYHIQQAVFQKAFEKYNEYDSTVSSGSALKNPLNLDTLGTAEDTDFGYVGRVMKGAWDTNYAVFNGMKALGADSIFVGHEHCNSSSIVYEGVRFQYSQKSSRYDRYNTVSADGTITGGYDSEHPTGAHPLMGGTVIPVSKEDGSIGTGYIYYACNPFYFEPKPVEVPVNGLKLTDSMLQSGKELTLRSLAFDERVNAYKITSNSESAKIYFDTTLAAQYKYFTFTALVDETATAQKSGVEFMLRVKPDNTLTQEQGSDGKYIYYQSNISSELRGLIRGQWKTFTVDISGVDDSCTEFSFMFNTGAVVWFRDIAFNNTQGLPDVNGLRITDSMLQEGYGMSVEKVAVDEQTSAYKVYATKQGKIFFDKDLAIKSSTFTFSVFVPKDSAGASSFEFCLRVKPDGTLTEAQDCTDGKYVYYTSSKVPRGEWRTFTVDISVVGENCTEFSIMLAAGTTLLIKDVAFA